MTNENVHFIELDDERIYSKELNFAQHILFQIIQIIFLIKFFKLLVIVCRRSVEIRYAVPKFIRSNKWEQFVELSNFS